MDYIGLGKNHNAKKKKKSMQLQVTMQATVKVTTLQQKAQSKGKAHNISQIANRIYTVNYRELISIKQCQISPLNISSIKGQHKYAITAIHAVVTDTQSMCCVKLSWQMVHLKLEQKLFTHTTTHEQVSFQTHQLQADRIRRTLTGETLTSIQRFKSP